MENEDAGVVSRTEERKREKGRGGGPCGEALRKREIGPEDAGKVRETF